VCVFSITIPILSDVCGYGWFQQNICRLSYRPCSLQIYVCLHFVYTLKNQWSWVLFFSWYGDGYSTAASRQFETESKPLCGSCTSHVWQRRSLENRRAETLRIPGGRVWIVVDWMHLARDRDRWRLLWTRWWTFGFRKGRGISWLAEWLSASEGLCYSTPWRALESWRHYIEPDRCVRDERCIDHLRTWSQSPLN
jgi:hypothetical protein